MDQRDRAELAASNNKDAEGEEPDYMMPLAGGSGSSAGSAGPSPVIDMRGIGSPSLAYGGNRPSGNRRGSHLTESTQRVQNYTTADDGRYNYHQEQYETSPSSSPMHRLAPRLPVYDSNDEGGSINTPNNNNISDSGGEGEDEGGSYVYEGGSIDEVSQTSYNSPSTTYLSTPVGNRQSSMYEVGTSRRQSSALHITFAGQIKEIPLTAADDQPEQNPGNNSISTESNNTGQRSRGKSIDSVGSNNSRQFIDNEDDVPSEDSQSEIHPLVCCGIVLPMCLSTLLQRPPSLSRISLFIVTVAPCFWCCGRSLQGSSTDRAVLTRLNVLSLFFALVQLVAGLWLATLVLILDDSRGALEGFSANLWNINGAVFAIGILGFVIIITCTCTIRVIKDVDLVGAIRHLWVLLWLLPFESFFSVSLFDYFNVTEVWIKHWWLQPQMSWFREHFCAPNTADNVCLVPLDGGPNYASEDDWCEANYQRDDCTEIRNDAQEKMEFAMLLFYNLLGGWSILTLCLMLLMLRSLEKIITKPIVQKSRETNVPAWLTLPTAGNALVGCIFLYSPTSLLGASSGTDNAWIGVLYLVAAGLFLLAMFLGWFLSTFSIQSSLDKKNKSVAVLIFIGVMAANVVILGTILVASIMFAGNLLSSPIDETQRGDIACFLDKGVGTCSACDDPVPENRCPEWSLDDVTRILQTQLKQSATLAAIFIVYAISVLRFGFVLRKHLSLYQIDYC